MSIEQLKNDLPEIAKDIKLNLASVLTEDGAPDLSLRQIYGIALASACATQSNHVTALITATAKELLTDAEINAAKSSAAIMAMNNVYLSCAKSSGIHAGDG